MTKSEINILIRARAKEARVVFAAVERDIYKITRSGAAAAGVLDGISGASLGYVAAFRNTSKAAADLAVALTAINRTGGTAAKHLLNLGAAAELAAPAMGAAAKSAAALTATLGPLGTVAGTAAGNLGALAAAQGAMGKTGKTAKAANAATAASVAGVGASSIVSASNIKKMNNAMNSAAVGGKSLTDKWRALNGQVAYSNKFVPGTAQSLARTNKAFQQSAWGVKQYGDAWNQAHGKIYNAVPQMNAVGSSMAKMQSALNISQWGAAGQAQAQYARSLGGTTTAYGQQIPVVSNATTTTSRFGDMMERTRTRASAFASGMGAMSDSMRKAGSQMQWTGRQLSVMFTAPTLLAVGLGVKWAMDQEKAFTHMSKVYQGAAEDIDTSLTQSGIQFQGSKLDNFATALSNKMGVVKSDVEETMATIAQMGATGADLAKMAQLATEVSIVGDMPLEQATQNLIAIQQQYRLSVDDLKVTMEELNIVSNNSGASFLDLTDAFARSASVARQAGIPTASLAGFIAALVPAAGSAATAGNGLKSIMTRLLTPTEQAADMMANFGIQVRDVGWMSDDGATRMAKLAVHFDELSQQQKMDLSKPFAGLYQINKFITLMDDLGSANSNAARTTDLANDATKRQAAYQTELNRVLESNPQKLKQAGVIIQNSLVKAITPLIPAIVWLAQAFARLTQSFSNLSPVTQKFIVIALLCLAAVGPLAMLLGSFWILAGVFGKSMVFMGKAARLFGFHMLGIGKLTKQVGDDVVRRTPLITRAWRAMLGVMRFITLAGVGAVNLAWKVGMGLFALVLKGGAALGLKRWGWYMSMMNRVTAVGGRQIIRTSAATQAGVVATVNAGGSAAVAAQSRNMAGGAAATRRGGKGWIGALLGVVMLFPGTIMKGIKAIPGMFNGSGGLWAKIVEGTRPALARIGTMFKELGPMILRILGRLAPRLGASAAMIAIGLTGPIGWAIDAILLLIMLFPKQAWEATKNVTMILLKPFIDFGKLGFELIKRIIRGLGSLFGDMGKRIGDALSGINQDDGIPMLAKPFVFGVKLIGAVMAELPKIVIKAFQAVLKVIRDAALAIYEAFSYINPFARHSPSLVENVTNGMAIVEDRFAHAASSIKLSTKQAYDAISKFGTATAGLKSRGDDFKRQEIVDKFNEVDPGGLGAYDELAAQLPRLNAQLEKATRNIDEQKIVIENWEKAIKDADKTIEGMEKTLDSLQETASSLGDALDKAKEQIDYFASAPITGMRAMSDAIFANELAQKKLRLEIMKMEEAGQSVDDVKDKFAALQGQIEELSGMRNDLRLGGAGSDILGTYDKMIADLQAQQGAVATDNLSPIQEAQKELERLQKEGEKLDLENALKFDPLTRQIDQMVNSTQELSFEAITAGIRVNQAAVAGLTVSYEAANQAVSEQEAAIKSAKEARDAMNDSLDIEQAKLDEMQKAHDELESAISAVETAMNDIISVLDLLIQKTKEAKDETEKLSKAEKDAAEAAADWAAAGLGDYEMPGGTFDGWDPSGDIDELTKQLTEDLGKMFGDIDISEAIGKFFDKIGEWFKQLPGKIGGWLAGVPGAIGSKIGEWAGNVGGWFAGLGTSIGNWFAGLWNDHMYPALSELPGKIGTFFTELPAKISEAVGYIMGYIAGMAVDFFIDAFNLGKKIGEYFAPGGGFAEDVGDLKQTMRDFVMNNIVFPIGDFIDGTFNVGTKIKEYFTSGRFATDVGEVLIVVTEWMRGVLTGIADFVTQDIPKWGFAVKDYFTSGRFWEDVKGVLGTLYDIGKNIVLGLLGGILAGALGIGSWIYEHFIQPMVDGFKDRLGINSPSTVFFDFGKNIVQGLMDGIGNMGNALVEYVKGFFKRNVIDKVTDLFDTHSPSRVFEAIGSYLGEGLVLGIDSSQSAVAGAAAGLADAAMIAPTAGTNPLAATADAFAVGFSEIGTTGVTAMGTMYANLAGMGTAYTVASSTELVNYSGVSAATFGTISTTGQMLMGQMSSGVTGTVAAMSDSMTDSMNKGKDAFTSASATLTDNVTNNFQSLATNLDTIMAEQIRPMMESFGPMLETVTGWFGTTVGNVGTIWEGIREPVAKPSRFIVNDVYNNGIRTAWNNVSGWIGLEELPAAVAAFKSGGAVDRNGLINPSTPRDIAGGGRLTGPSSGDRTLFAGQGGEFVFSRPMVRAAGGAGVLESYRRAVMAGKNVEGGGSIMGFASGGEVPGIVKEAEKWARGTFTGQTYDYGGVGPNGFDCSGAVGAMWGYLTQQRNPFQRFFTTEADFSKYGFERGLNGYFTMGVHNGGGGMLSHMAATLAGTNLEAGGAHNSSIFGGPAAGADNRQFENQYTLKELGGVFESGGMGGGFAPSMLQRVTEEFKKVMDPIGSSMPQFQGMIGQLGQSGYQKYYDDVSKHLYGKASEYDVDHPAMGNMAYDGAGVEQWRPLVQKILKEKGLPLSLDERVLMQMQTESGGNPNALNDWDSNWLKGTPSKGLMQVIDPTFLSNMDPGYGNIWAPEDNIRASINYALRQYGSLENAYRGVGYDRGGWLMPGEQQKVFNATGKPEAVLTNSDWNAIYAAANNPVDVDMISTGTLNAMQEAFGTTPTSGIADAYKTALTGVNATWVPALLGTADDAATAADAAAKAAANTSKGVDKFTEVGSQISKSVDAFSVLMLAAATAMEQVAGGDGSVTFGMVAPVLEALGGFIGSLPDAEPTYVPWAGSNQVVTGEMAQQKRLNDVANIGKGLYQIVKGLAPTVLKHTAKIGTALEQIITQDGAMWSTAIGAIMTGNPMGALIAIPTILKNIFTMVPLIIQAITEIVPMLIKAIIQFFTKFLPDSVYAYESLDAAEKAVKDNEAAIRQGATGPNFATPTTVQQNTNQTIVVNVYGLELPNITSGDQASDLIGNLQVLAGNN